MFLITTHLTSFILETRWSLFAGFIWRVFVSKLRQERA
jgi:hypothetical protein